MRNLLRLWGGWNGNAADLLPATHEKQRARSRCWPVASTSWSRAGAPCSTPAMAAHLAEWAPAAPADRDAQRLKRDGYERRLGDESALMAQGIYRAAMNDARHALKEEPQQSHRPGEDY